MTLHEIIQREYPDAEPDQYRIMQDGTLVTIERWEVRDNGLFTARPSEQQVKQWIDSAENELQLDLQREASLKRVAGLSIRTLVGRPVASLTADELQQLARARYLVTGVTDVRGVVLPAEQWHDYQEEELGL